MIEGVRVKKLRVIPDERGRLMEILRSDDDIFDKFGQVYMTTAYPEVTKAWHYHKKQDDHFCCVSGKIKLALYDAREGSSTRGEVNEFIMSTDNPMVVKIPRMVYHGFKCISNYEAKVINVPTEPYDRDNPDEYRVEVDAKDIPYDWSA